MDLSSSLVYAPPPTNNPDVDEGEKELVKPKSKEKKISKNDKTSKSKIKTNEKVKKSKKEERIRKRR